MNLIKRKKLSSVLLIEISEILQEKIINNKNNLLITLIKVEITKNMEYIKAFINIYPYSNKYIENYIKYKSNMFRKLLCKRLRYRVKKIPKLIFIFKIS